MAALGYEWVVLQLDDDGSSADVRETAEYNRSVWPEFCEQMRLRKVKAGGWVTQGGNIYLIPGDADLAIAEQEGPGDYDGIVNCLGGVGAGPVPQVPLGVVTNFSTLNRDRAKVLIDAGFTCLPEAYMNQNPSMTPENQDRIARNLGWPSSQPVAGVYPWQGQPVPSYEPYEAKYGPFDDYLLEYVL